MQKKEIHPIDIYAGEQLREARKAKGISQDTLAIQIEHPVTFQQIQKYERGSNRLAASKLWEFAEALNVPPGFFFPSSEAHIKEANLLRYFRNLSEDKKKALLILIEQSED
ncbi:MAG: transcriptional regulator [Rickettsiales bacterium]|nr:transcriptional regulator [Rickettsiales bacterium]|tara:strand:- start:742 stop:1074 length:333 start_codon:yes stop_codon:yes gene_type:complete